MTEQELEKAIKEAVDAKNKYVKQQEYAKAAKERDRETLLLNQLEKLRMAHTHIGNIDLKELKIQLSEAYDNYYDFEEYGHVGCYELTEEQVKEKSDKAIELIKQANALFDEINKSITDSFEH